MPVYNGERYLREAIDSILSQSYANFELIIVDDGSTDGSLSILREYEKKDARVKAISRPNTGIVGALNDAIAASGGEYLARMDADDVALPNRFDVQVRYLDEHPEVVMLGSRVIMIDADGWDIGDMVSVGHGHQEIDDALLGGGWPIVHPTVVMRREAVEKVGRYHEGTFPNEDHDLFLRLAEIGQLDNLREPLLKYRRHMQSVVFAKTRGSRTVLWKVVNEAFGRRGMGEAPDWDAENAKKPKWKGPPWSQHRDWAWTALKCGNIATARKYAVGAVKERPWCKEAWRVLYCALRGR
jgi:glycosyltransferase involved in cell wall biosynthesis